MDLATVIGVIIAWVLIGLTIMVGGSPSTFLNFQSITIVLGGTLAVTLMKFNLKQFINAAKTAANAFIHKSEDMDDLVSQLVELAITARKGGMLSMENVEIKDPALKTGITMLVDGMDKETIRKSYMTELKATVKRHKIGQRIFKGFGDVAPAMGMIGTLIGLVQMLSNMDDPKSIGPAMAVALLTTLYGAMLAHAFALPIAEKLSLRTDEEIANRTLILDGLISIHDGVNPKIMEELLNNHLPKKKPSKTDVAANDEPNQEAA